MRAALLALLLVAGCQARTVVRSAGPEGPDVVRATSHVFLWGWLDDDVQTGLVAVTRVDTYREWWHYVACLASCGLWLPQGVDVYGWHHLPGGWGPGGVVQNVNVSTPVTVNTAPGAVTTTSGGGAAVGE